MRKWREKISDYNEMCRRVPIFKLLMCAYVKWKCSYFEVIITQVDSYSRCKHSNAPYSLATVLFIICLTAHCHTHAVRIARKSPHKKASQGDWRKTGSSCHLLASAGWVKALTRKQQSRARPWHGMTDGWLACCDCRKRRLDALHTHTHTH